MTFPKTKEEWLKYYGREVTTEDPSVKVGGRYQDSDGALSTIGNALDITGNTSRSAITGYLKGGMDLAIESGKKAFNKEIYTDPSELKTALGIPTFDKGKGFDSGDVLDVGINLAVDIGSDPLTLLPFVGIGSKAGKLTKYLPTVKHNIDVLRGGLGGLYGYGAANKDDSLTETAVKVGIGAAIGLTAPQYMPKVRRVADKAMRGAGDAFTRMTGKVAPEGKSTLNMVYDPKKKKMVPDKLSFKDIDVSKTNAQAGIKHGEMIGRDIQDSYENIIKPLSPVEQVLLSDNLLKPLKTFIVNKRNSYLDKVHINGDGGKIFKTILKKVKDKNPDLNDEALEKLAHESFRKTSYYQERARVATQSVNKLAREAEAPRLLNEMGKHLSTEMKVAFKQFEQHNKTVMKDYNIAMKKHKADHIDVEGLAFHIPDEYEATLKSYIKNTNTMPKLHFARSGDRSKEVDKVAQMLIDSGKYTAEQAVDARAEAYRQIYQVYSRKMAYKMIDPVEREAIQVMKAYQNQIAPATKTWDTLTSHIKVNQLFASSTWVTTNYWDNLRKTYVDYGLIPTLKVAKLGLFDSNGLGRDLKRAIFNEGNEAFKNPALMKELHRTGVIETDFFKNMASDHTKHLIIPPRPLDSAVEAANGPGGLVDGIISYIREQGKMGEHLAHQFTKGMNVGEKGLGKWNDMWKNSVGKGGSYMEQYARASTYLDTKRVIQKSGKFSHLNPAEIEKMAANVAIDTFFDYPKLYHIEHEMMRRIIPYYAFVSKNAMYWMEALADPNRIREINNLQKAERQVGENPNRKLREGLDEYLKFRHPRYIGTERGERKIVVNKSASSDEAIHMLDPFLNGEYMKSLDQVVEKMHPMIKLFAEPLMNKDTFTGGNYGAKGNYRDRKPMFSGGYKYAAGGILGSDAPVKLDRSNNPYTKSDMMIFLDKFFSSIQVPVVGTPLVSQIAGDVGKWHYKDVPAEELITNRLSPMSINRVSNKRLKYQRRLDKGQKKLNRKEDRESRRNADNWFD